MALVVRADFHWLLDRRVKVKSLLPASARLSATALHFSRHFKRLAAGFHLGGSVGIDHIAVIFAQLVMHVFGSMTQKVAVLVHGAALNGKVIAPKRRQSRLQSRRAIDDDKPGPFQSTRIKVVEELAPRRLAPEEGAKFMERWRAWSAGIASAYINRGNPVGKSNTVTLIWRRR